MLNIKTLIELFDSVQIENIVSGLRFEPKKIVFIGFKEIMKNNRIQDVKDFFSQRNKNISTEFEIVGRYDYSAIVDKLNRIIDTNEDCIFDLTGGKELVLAAMGEVAALRNVPMFQTNVRTGSLVRIKGCDDLSEPPIKHLSIEECVKINGCSVIHGAEGEVEWELDEDFKSDLQTIWGISRQNSGLWNRQSNVFASFERFGFLDDELRVSANLERMRDCKQDTLLESGVINQLIGNFLIDYSEENDYVTFKYKNKQVHDCITKAGNILELYAYMLMREIAEEEQGYYDDIDIGVYIDWDGTLHGEYGKQRDTTNEIDIMVMRDLVPIFISCKNGEVHKEDLYELSVVARKFGGRYAKKFMLATYVTGDELSAKYLAQRANDMGIELIDNLHFMSRDEIKEIIKNRIK